MTRASRPLGVYVHFPYCRKRCPYCDFAIAVRKVIPHERYRDRVLAELATRAPLFTDAAEPRHLESIYFGGGTPGLWEPRCIADVIAAITARWPGVPREITVEVNPGDLDLAALPALRAAGVTRVSVGAQRSDAARLAELGRWHVAAQTSALVAAAHALGFSVSVDLIFALPGETAEELARELALLLALDCAHVSTYCLTIEPRTAFSAAVRRGALAPLPDDYAADRYEQVIDALEAAGLRQYEVSSFARPGAEAVHNSLYWTGGEYLGLGVSASSLRVVDGRHERWQNPRAVDAWFGADTRLEHELLSAEASEREAVWLALRRTAGIDRLAHVLRFGVDPVAARPGLVATLEAEGLVAVDATTLRLTRRGRLQADAIAVRLL